MTDRAKLCLRRGPWILVFRLLLPLVLTSSACSPAPRSTGVYTLDTRQLVRLDYDYDGNGAIDVRTYVRHGRVVRIEGDTNRDGIVDRWEYYGASGQMLRVGGSSVGDGREDIWVRTTGGDRVVEISTRRDGVVDRREIYRQDQLVRAESDTNHDGLTDQWEEFTGAAVTALLLDDDKRHGRPTRRLVYGPGGSTRVEMLRREDGDAAR